jgi:hypothetical protein
MDFTYWAKGQLLHAIIINNWQPSWCWRTRKGKYQPLEEGTALFLGVAFLEDAAAAVDLALAGVFLVGVFFLFVNIFSGRAALCKSATDFKF